MERYESLGLVGEGSYGTVLKCRHRDSGRLVAIKKFMDSDNDKTVKKIALREIKLLRQLRHDNLVNLLEVWKRRRRWHLVFEFVERTLLDDLEQNPNGLDLNTSRQYLYQILRAAAFCHQQNIIHRDIKPENILISQGGVVKLCDFGFARTMTSPAEGGVYTDYVATRWYRAPELLVGDTKYSKPVDVWAVGCLLIEMLTGQPLFPGDSDLDQIYHIVRCFGNLTAHHQELFYRNPVFSGVRLPEYFGRVRLEQRFPTITPTALDLAQSCLQMDPERRAQCSELLEHPLFTQDSFHIRVLDELNAKIQKDHRENSTLPKIAKNPRREKDEGDEKNWRGKYKKQSEDIDVKVSKEKVRKGEEKVEKTKGKQSSKPSKTIRNTSEPFMSTKQSKTLGVKIIENAAKTTVAMKSKLGKPTGAELRKEADISRPTKIVASDSSEGADQKENYTVVAKPKHEKAASPEPRQDNLKATKNTTTDTVQRGTSESSKVLPSDPSPSKTTSNCGSKMTTSNTSLSTSPSKTLISEFLTRSSTVFIEASPDHSPTTLPKGTLNSKLSKTDSSSDTTTTTNHPTFVPNKALKVLSTDRELKELLIATKNQQDSCSNTSNKDISDDYESMKMSQATKTAENHIEISNGSSRYYKGDPDSSEPSRVHQQSTSKSKITTESRTSLTSIPNEIPITNTSLWTTIPKTLNVSDKENREDLAFSVSISATTKSFVNQISKVSRNSTTEQKNDSSEVTTDQRALTRSSVFHNVDSADVDTFDFSVSHSSPVPPAPLPPSSTPLIPSFSFISTNSPVSSDRLTLGAGFHPGTNSFRCVEKPRHHGGIYSRMTQKSLSSHITGSLTAQVPEKSLICERSFLSDRFGNNITATRKKSDIHFPDLRSSTLPELRGRESKHNKGASKDQRKDKHPDFSNPTSESAE
ncbi:cyclin-dependent kinase-like 3 isoform X2 [Micropterus salmoides]|uniref:cyclin-dependent kinase-like 3 isoform X2 n=1 Tax=Micropterus salmoides TaxID=27706 RepID=UPI0018ED1BD8|nr:cyclin-dependent kinase-like 3 isoform X2 [Micropterus salmoides]